MTLFVILYSDQQRHNNFTNYHTLACFDTIVSSSGSCGHLNETGHAAQHTLWFGIYRSSTTVSSTHRLYIQPTHRLYTQPTHRLYTQPTHRLYIEPTHRLYIEPTHRLYTQPTHRLYTQPTHRLYTQPTHRLYIEPTHRLNEWEL